jgi:RNA polymerase sigma factor (sigma-70 family)
MIHARARRLVGADADDVVQEVFLRLIAKPPAIVDMTAWMYTTATNVALDRLRFVARRDAAWRAEVTRHAERERPSSVDEVLASRQLCRAILLRVDRHTQEVVTLVIFDEMTQEQAAETLGISRKSVNERLRRFRVQAEKQLRRWSP